MGTPSKYRALDTRLQHRAPGSAALTADTTIATWDTRGPSRTEYVTRINIEALAVDGGDEVYDFIIELSDDDFSTVAWEAARFRTGDASATGFDNDGVAGDHYEILWSNEVNGVVYPDMRLRLDGTGSTFSITFNAYSAPLE